MAIFTWADHRNGLIMVAVSLMALVVGSTLKNNPKYGFWFSEKMRWRTRSNRGWPRKTKPKWCLWTTKLNRICSSKVVFWGSDPLVISHSLTYYFGLIFLSPYYFFLWKINLKIYLHANKSYIYVVIDRDRFDVPDSKQYILFWVVILRYHQTDISIKHTVWLYFITRKWNIN